MMFVGLIATINYSQILNGIALSSLPAVIILLVYSRYSKKLVLDYVHVSRLTINYLAVIAIIIGLVSLTLSILNIVIPTDTNNVVNSRGYAYEIFLLLSSFSPIFLLLLITCIPVKLLMDFVKTKAHRSLFQTATLYKAMTTKTKIVFLSLSITLSIVIATIPHLPAINNDNQFVGVDTVHYAAWIADLKNSKNAQDFIQQLFVEQSDGDRPISLLLIFSFQQMLSGVNSSAYTIEYLPLLFGPALVMVIYFFTKELTTNDAVSLFAAFLTAISFQTLIGIYAGFYANWIALIFGYLSLLFSFRYLERQRTKDLVLFGSFLILTLFSHLYTWSILALVTGIFLSVSLARPHLLRRGNYVIRMFSPVAKRPLLLLFAVLFCTVAMDIGRMALTGSSGGIERDLQVSERAGLEQFALRWNNLTYATTVYVGGLFANFMILGLGLYWLFTSNIKENQNIFVMIFLSLGILPFLFGEWVIQTRVFYDIPFQIPAAFALLHIERQAGSSMMLKLLPICIWLVVVSIIAVSNFHLVLPMNTSSN